MNNINDNTRIIRIAYDELSRNYKYDKQSKSLDSHVQIVSINDINRYLDHDNIKLVGVYQPCEGQILMRHPFAPNTFIDASMSPMDLFQDKVNKMGIVLQRLGVKSISGKARWIETKKREIDADGNIGIKSVGASGSFHTEETHDEYSDISISKSYPNAQLTQNLYSQAIDIAKQYGLYNDSQISALIESRNPALGSNVQGQEQVSVELSKEYNELTSIAFSLNVLKIFKIDFHYKENIETVNKVKIDLDIQF